MKSFGGEKKGKGRDGRRTKKMGESWEEEKRENKPRRQMERTTTKED